MKGPDANNSDVRSIHWWISCWASHYFCIYTHSHDLISYIILASSAPTLWGSAGHLFSKAHPVLAINLNLDVYSTNPCHLDYLNHCAPCPLITGIMCRKCKGSFQEIHHMFFSPHSLQLCLLLLYLRFIHIRRFTVCFATGARNARLRNNSLYDRLETRQVTQHCRSKTCAQCVLGNRCPECTKTLQWALSLGLTLAGMSLCGTVFALLLLMNSH